MFLNHPLKDFKFIIGHMRFKDLPPNVRHTFYYDIKAGMLIGIFGGFLLPFITIVGRKIGASDFQIALLTAAPYLANAFALLWTEDLFGKGRVWYVVWPCVLGRGLLLAMFFITGPFYYTLLIFIYMFITAIPFPSYAFIMKTNYPDELRGRLMAYARVATAVFWTASSAAGGWVLERGTFNYRYIFPIAAVFGVLSALQFSSIKVRGEKRQKESFSGITRLSLPLKDSSFRKFLIAYTFFESGLLLALPVYPLVLVDQAHISNFATGIYGSAYSSMWLAGFFFWGHFLDRHTERWALVAVFLVACFVPVLYILSRDIFILGVAQGISGFVFAAIELTNYIVITRVARPKEVPYYMAANIALGGARGAIAPFIGTALLAARGADAVFYISLLLMGISLLLAWNMLKK